MGMHHGWRLRRIPISMPGVHGQCWRRLGRGGQYGAWMFGGGFPYGFVNTYGLNLALGAGAGIGFAHVFYGAPSLTKSVSGYDPFPSKDIPLDP